MKSLKNQKVVFCKTALLISTVLSLCVNPAAGQSATRTTLAITATQGALLNDARNLVLVYCIANRLTIVGAEVSMNLRVRVGDSTVSFQENGTKELHVPASDQDYAFGGRSVAAFRAVNQRGVTSSIRVVYSYVGDGTVRVAAGDAGSTLRLAVRTVNSRVVGMDLSSGEGELEVTLGL